MESNGSSIHKPPNLLPEDPEFKRLFTRDVYLTLGILLTLFIGVAVASLFFGKQIDHFTNWMAENFGLIGLGTMVFISDTFVSPLPPDLVLLVVAKSSLRTTWWWSIPLIGIISMLAGHGGWLIGRALGHTKFGSLLAGPRADKQRKFVEKYGVWAVILGAATPVPYSVTCWAAGFLGMPWRSFALAALFRVPRFIIYYMVIHLSDLMI